MMTNAFPFALADRLIDLIGTRFTPPPWAVTEVQSRLVLLFNHVLQQEPQAMQRLARQSGRVVHLRWRQFAIRLSATRAGLLELAAAEAADELTLELTDPLASGIADKLLRGDKPAVRIEGDVLLAAEVNWLADHVRWDIEEDLSRLIGDAPAHALADASRRAARSLGSLMSRRQAAA